MNCETCNAKLPTLKTRLARVNEALHALGLPYHVYLPVFQVDTALIDNGFRATGLWDEFNGTARTHEEVGDGKWVTNPRTMLRWAAMREGARAFAQDIVNNMYTPDELGGKIRPAEFEAEDEAA